MRIATNGILVNELSEVLLIQRNDTRTFAPPGGGVERGELPTENIVREVREETGIIAMPVRLVSLTFWPMKPAGLLTFTFRCLRRGGEIQTSPESPRVGFFKPTPLPQPMLALSRKRIEQGLRHAGGPVDWWVIEDTAVMRFGRFFLFHIIHRWLGLKRRLQKEPPFVPPPDWSVDTRLVIQNEAGQILTLENESSWELPGGTANHLEAPWETAVAQAKNQTGLDIELTNLSGVYVREDSSRMTLLFTAVVHTPQSTKGTWQTNPVPQKKHLHLFLKDADAARSETMFRTLKDED